MNNSLISQIRLYFTHTLGLPESDADELIAIARQTLEEGIAGLETSLNQNDIPQVRYWAHSLKGNFQNLGLHDLAQNALKMENAALAKDIQLAAELVTPIKHAISRILNFEFDADSSLLDSNTT